MCKYANFLYQTVMSYGVIPVRYCWKRNINLDKIIAKVPLTSLIACARHLYLACFRQVDKEAHGNYHDIIPDAWQLFSIQISPFHCHMVLRTALKLLSRERDEARVVKQLTALSIKINRKLQRT
jgi:hypothetical protein